MYRLVIFLDDPDADALKALAKKEYRDTRSQAVLILKDYLAHERSSSSDATPAELLNPKHEVMNKTPINGDEDKNDKIK